MGTMVVTPAAFILVMVVAVPENDDRADSDRSRVCLDFDLNVTPHSASRSRSACGSVAWRS